MLPLIGFPAKWKISYDSDLSFQLLYPGNPVILSSDSSTYVRHESLGAFLYLDNTLVFSLGWQGRPYQDEGK